jgi:hypothetical protein
MSSIDVRQYTQAPSAAGGIRSSASDSASRSASESGL